MTIDRVQGYTVTVGDIVHTVPVPEVFPVSGGPGYVTKAAYLQLMKEYLSATWGKSANSPVIPATSSDISDDTVRIPEGYRLIKDDYDGIFQGIASALGPINGKSVSISCSKFLNYMNSQSDLDESEIQYITKSASIPEY